MPKTTQEPRLTVVDDGETPHFVLEGLAEEEPETDEAGQQEPTEEELENALQASVSVSVIPSPPPLPEANAAMAALQWENREQKTSRGFLKTVGSAGPSAALSVADTIIAKAPDVAAAAGSVGEHAGLAGSIVGGGIAFRRLLNTGRVLGQLYELTENGWLSEDAKKDAEYVIGKKQRKLARAGASMVPVVSTGVTLQKVAKFAYKKKKGTQGKHRRIVAERMYARFIEGDPHYRNLVEALFKNKPQPSKWTFYLEVCPDKDLAVNVLMTKIASK